MQTFLWDSFIVEGLEWNKVNGVQRLVGAIFALFAKIAHCVYYLIGQSRILTWTIKLDNGFDHSVSRGLVIFICYQKI